MRAKVLPSHVDRRALVYVRQSTPMQVHEHVESKQRQYALAERAIALGWRRADVEVIDEDQGKSGATSEGRSGFGRLADAVARGEAGAVLAIEMSRLARSSSDWQRLLQVCAVADVLVIDEQTVYDPADKDDKLLLDLKGTMSEAELHWLRLRLVGGRMNKARRGELEVRPPTGYVWGERGFRVDPDEAVRRAIHLVFERFAVEPTAWAVARWANHNGVKVPVRRWYADGSSEIEWRGLTLGWLSRLLHNPTYAGMYAYGRRAKRSVLVDGQIRRRVMKLAETEWTVRLSDAHPGYIDWETFVKNQDKLRDNQSQRQGATRGAPNRGSALLSGLLVCGRCGRAMRTQYGRHKVASYYCNGEHDRGGSMCWTVPTEKIDAAVEALFLETMVPTELDLSLAVQGEADRHAQSLANQWRARIEQATYEARRAERRYKAVDPDNRVVARTLEREWEQRLRDVEEVERQYAEARRARHVELTDDDRARIRALARDLPRVWRSPTTKPEERKAMLRLVIEAVALSPVDVPRRLTHIKVQWQSGLVNELRVERPYRHRPQDDVVARARVLAAQGHHDEVIAETLNAEGFVTGRGHRWTTTHVMKLRSAHGIARVAQTRRHDQSLPDRHPTTGHYSLPGAARHFHVSEWLLKSWIRRGLIPMHHARYGRYHARWLDIDDSTATALEALARPPRSTDT